MPSGERPSAEALARPVPPIETFVAVTPRAVPLAPTAAPGGACPVPVVLTVGRGAPFEACGAGCAWGADAGRASPFGTTACGVCAPPGRADAPAMGVAAARRLPCVFAEGLPPVGVFPFPCVALGAARVIAAGGAPAGLARDALSSTGA